MKIPHLALALPLLLILLAARATAAQDPEGAQPAPAPAADRDAPPAPDFEALLPPGVPHFEYVESDTQRSLRIHRPTEPGFVRWWTLTQRLDESQTLTLQVHGYAADDHLQDLVITEETEGHRIQRLALGELAPIPSNWSYVNACDRDPFVSNEMIEWRELRSTVLWALLETGRMDVLPAEDSTPREPLLSFVLDPEERRALIWFAYHHVIGAVEGRPAWFARMGYSVDTAVRSDDAPPAPDFEAVLPSGHRRFGFGEVVRTRVLTLVRECPSGAVRVWTFAQSLDGAQRLVVGLVNLVPDSDREGLIGISEDTHEHAIGLSIGRGYVPAIAFETKAVEEQGFATREDVLWDLWCSPNLVRILRAREPACSTPWAEGGRWGCLWTSIRRSGPR